MGLLIITYGTEGDASALGIAQLLGMPSQALAGDIHATIAADGAMRNLTRTCGYRLQVNL